MDISVFHQVSLFDFLRIRLGLTVVVFLWGSVSASYQNNLGSTQDFATLNWFYWQTSLTLSYWLKGLDALLRFLFFCSHSLWNATLPHGHCQPMFIFCNLPPARNIPEFLNFTRQNWEWAVFYSSILNKLSVFVQLSPRFQKKLIFKNA